MRSQAHGPRFRGATNGKAADLIAAAFAEKTGKIRSFSNVCAAAGCSGSAGTVRRRKGLDRRFDAAAELVAGEIMVEELHLLALAFGGGVREGEPRSAARATPRRAPARRAGQPPTRRRCGRIRRRLSGSGVPTMTARSAPCLFERGAQILDQLVLVFE
jgi:hypothetical protein